MSDVIDLLHRLNRKERHLLIAALGKPRFEPDAGFLRRVCKRLALDAPPAETVSGFMDFHLDWLYAALELASPENASKVCFPSPGFPSSDPALPGFNVNTNPEDIDLLLAWDEPKGPTRLVLIEAKGVTNWGTKQLRSKASRLGHIFDGKKYAFAVPHFVLASPERSERLEKSLTKGIPPWMRVDGALPWIELEMNRKAIEIERCGKAPGSVASASGDHWRVKKRKKEGVGVGHVPSNGKGLGKG